MDDNEEMIFTVENDMAATLMLKTKQAKQALRVTTRKALRQVSLQGIENQSSIVIQKLSSLDVYQRAKSISIFLSMPAGEIVTRDLVHDSLDKGKTVYVPYIVDNAAVGKRPDNEAIPTGKIMDMVSLHSWSDFQQCEENRDRWGIPSISESSLPQRKWVLDESVSESESDSNSRKPSLDLIVMPGQAFDRHLHRLGHGKGFYDTFLSRYRNAKPSTSSSDPSMPCLIGVALEEQVLPLSDKIPVQENDWDLDVLVVGDGSIIWQD